MKRNCDAGKTNVIAAWAIALFFSILFPSSTTVAGEKEDFFEERIRPVLVKHCYECHAADSSILRGGLQLDYRDGLLKGGDSGPAIVPGEAKSSLLLNALKHDGFEMPPAGKLSDSVIADFEKWIAEGAIDPRSEFQRPKLKPVDWDEGRKHWAFNPVADVSLPRVDAKGRRWSKHPIDRFVYAKQKEAGFTAAAFADKRTLIRRATFDLIGLPPTIDEVDAFVADMSADSYERLVDRLLASPAYGERWARHWLDLVRYATSNGADENHELPVAYRYRDWVVRAMNDDMPYDQFLSQQLAGDLLPQPIDEKEAGELLTATGMLVLGPKMLAEQDKEKMTMDIIDEQVDTFGKTFLGLTLGCARCHDHKFDPISTEDYYALAGIFASTKSMANRDFVSKWLERPLPSKEIAKARVALEPEVNAAKSELERLKELRKRPADASAKDSDAKASKQPSTSKREKNLISKYAIELQEARVKLLEEKEPKYELVMALDDDTVRELPVHIRGNHLTLGDKPIARGFPAILENGVKSTIDSKSSGRLELARWLVSPSNPLTARVMVNRVWMWHFGKGLASAPSNFGLQSESPVHRELLDWLAKDFVTGGWSLKALHRSIMTSATYQQSIHSQSADETRDPENRFWRRANSKRLEAEVFRDSILMLGGELDRSFGGIAPNTESLRRSIYLPINRTSIYDLFAIFDYVDASSHLEQRFASTVPQQALLSMNNHLVMRCSQNFAEECQRRIDFQSDEGRQKLIEDAFLKALSREPTQKEMTYCLQVLESLEKVQPMDLTVSEKFHRSWIAFCQGLLATNEFMFVE